MLWNALAPELWRRTTIALHRALGRLAGLQERELRRLIRISYAKVAELQRRGAIHVVIRLDAATDCRCPVCLAPRPGASPPPSSRTLYAWPSRLSGCPARPPRLAARSGMPAGASSSTSATSPAPTTWRGSCRPSRWLHRQVRDQGHRELRRGLDHRLGADDLEHLDGLPAHVAELVRACWALGGRRELDGLRLRPWAHMLGFRGHWSTKSRRYSTTFTVLRRARVAFARRRRARDGVPWTPGAGPRATRP